MSRYQPILDVLINSKDYNRVYYHHNEEGLPNPYRDICYKRRIALQEQCGKGQKKQKKWADMCGIKNDKVKIIIEEELKPTEKKVENDIEKISKCKSLWIDKDYSFDPDCVLFVLLNNNIKDVPEQVIENKGSLKRIVVCGTELCQDNYTQCG